MNIQGDYRIKYITFFSVYSFRELTLHIVVMVVHVSAYIRMSRQNEPAQNRKEY